MRATLDNLTQAWRLGRRRVVDLLFTPQCAVCHADLPNGQETQLCDGCRGQLATVSALRCGRCGVKVPLPVEPDQRCASCRELSLHFDSVTPLGDYDGLLRQAVLLMKKWQREPLSLTLGRLVAERLADQLATIKPDRIVPVPMYWLRRLWRATNSPDLVAEVLSAGLRIPFDHRTLVRVRHTEQQSVLAPSRRHENVRGAFRVRDGHCIADKTILIVDDVLTTGATCSEAAKMLKQAGAKAVHVCVLARAKGTL